MRACCYGGVSPTGVTVPEDLFVDENWCELHRAPSDLQLDQFNFFERLYPWVKPSLDAGPSDLESGLG